MELNREEKPVFERAQENFENKNYNSAKEDFSLLLSLYPREAYFNYAYAACLVNINSKLPDAIRFLNYSAQNGEKRSYYYLGLANHLRYMFDKAIVSYEKFIELTDSKERKNFPVNRQIRMAHNGAELIKYAYKLDVRKNKKIKAENFYYSYETSNAYGEIVVIPNEFKSKLDKRRDYEGLMYVSHLHKKAYFSSYGDNKNNSLDIYVVFKVNGAWREPKKVPGNVNTDEDESFPFLHPNGTTLFFSSKGHNSMGGYDIFQSQYDLNNNNWSNPENLDFPINTPLDDIQYVTDMFNEMAYFASNRETEANRISVYQIVIEQNPELHKLENLEDVLEKSLLEVTPFLSENILQRDNEDLNISNYNSNSDSLSMPDENSGLISDERRITNFNDDRNNSISALIVINDLQTQYKNMAISAYGSIEQAITEIDLLNTQRDKIKRSNLSDKEIEHKLNIIDQQIEEQVYVLNESVKLAEYYNDLNEEYTSQLNYFTNEIVAFKEVTDPTDEDIATMQQVLKDIQKYQDENSSQKYLDKQYTSLERDKTKYDDYKSQLNDLNDKIDNIESEISDISDKALSTTDYSLQKQYVQQVDRLRESQATLIAEYKNIRTQYEFASRNVKKAEMILHETSILLSEIEKDSMAILPNDIPDLQKRAEQIASKQRQKELQELAELQNDILDNNYFVFPSPSLAEIIEENNRIRKEYENDEIVLNNYIALENDEKIKTNNYSEYIDEARKIVEDINHLKSQLDTNQNEENRKLIVESINNKQTELASIIENLEDEVATINQEWIAAIPEKDKVSTANERKKISDELTGFSDTSYQNKRTNIEEYYHISDSLNLLAQQASNSEQVALNYKQKATYYEDLGNKEADNLLSIATEERDQNNLIAQVSDSTILANNNIQEVGISTQDTISNEDIVENIITSEKTKFSLEEIAIASDSIDKAYRNNNNDIAWNDVDKLYKDTKKDIKKLKEEEDYATQKRLAQQADKNYEEAKLQHYNYATQSIDRNMDKYLFYDKNYEETDVSEVSENNKQIAEEYKNEAIYLHNKASNLLIEAEEISDDKLKQEKTIEAYKYEEMAVESYDKTYEVLRNRKEEEEYISIESTYSHEAELSDIVDINKDYSEYIHPIVYRDYSTEILVIEKESQKSANQANTYLTTADSLSEEIIVLKTDYLNAKDANLQRQIADEIINLNTQRLEAIDNATLSISEYHDQQYEINHLLIEKEYDNLSESQKQKASELEAEHQKYEERKESLSDNSNTIDEYILLGDIIIMGENLLEAQKRLIGIIQESERMHIIFNKRIANISNEMLSTEAWISENSIIEDEVNIVLVSDCNELINTVIESSTIASTTKDLEKLTEERKELNEEIAQANIRIEEIKRNIANAEEGDISRLEKELQRAEKKQVKLIQKEENNTNKSLELAYSTSKTNLNNQDASYETVIEKANDLEILADTLYNQAQWIKEEASKNRNNIGETAYQEEIKKANDLEIESVSILITANNLKIDDNPETANTIYTQYEEKINFYKPQDEELANNTEITEDTISGNQEIIVENTNINENNERRYEIYAELFYENSKEEKQYEKYTNKAQKIDSKLDRTEDKILELSNDELGDKTNNRRINRLEKKQRKLTYKNQQLDYDRTQMAYRQSKLITDTLDCSFREIRVYSDSLLNLADISFKKASIIRAELLENYDLSLEIKEINTNKAIALEGEAIDLQQEAIEILLADNPEIIGISLISDNQTENTDSSFVYLANDTVSSLDIADNSVDSIEVDINTDITINDDREIVITDQNELPSFRVLAIDENIPNASNLNESIDASGLIFRIQIAAYYKLVPETTFNGLSPLFHEQIQGQRIIRYMTGSFYTYEGAKAALPKVRQVGFGDAFIVAYLNGIRIPLYEARKLLDDARGIAYNKQVEDELSMVNANQEIVDNANYQLLTLNDNREVETTNDANVPVEDNALDIPTNINTSKNVFFTVQIGAAKTLMRKDRLSGINPDYVEYANNGYIRHLNGTYYTLNDAINSKNYIKRNGIGDAFVSAYAYGKKVTINEALALLAQMSENEISTNRADEKEIETNNELTTIPKENTNPEIEFFVQIGAYNTEVGEERMNNFTNISEGTNITLLKYDNGLKVYRIGPIDNIEQAKYYQTRAKASGITDAFILVYKNGKKVPLNQVL